MNPTGGLASVHPLAEAASTALAHVDADSVTLMTYDVAIAVDDASTGRRGPAAMKFRHTFAKLSDGTWTQRTESYGPDGAQILPFSSMLRRHDSSFVLAADGRPLGSQRDETGDALDRAQTAARDSIGSRLRDSLARAMVPRIQVRARNARLSLIEAVLARKSTGERAHELFRQASAARTTMPDSTIRYVGRIGAASYDTRLDSATGAVLTQHTIHDDGGEVTVLNEYSRMPGGALLRTRSLSRYSAGSAGPMKTVTVTYTNHKLR